MTPEMLVQQQLDAYNAKDINALMATYAENVQVFEHPATLLAANALELRERQIVRLQEPNLHAKLLNRIVSGNLVIDYELVTRTFPEGTGTLEMVAMYEVEADKISKAWFVFGAKTLDV